MDELSTIGISHLGFLNKGRNPEYAGLRPEELGITNGNCEDIKPLNIIEDEAIEAEPPNRYYKAEPCNKSKTF